MHPVIPYVTASLLFGIGTFGVLRRRNAILLLMAVELMLNAVNLILVTAGVETLTGQVFALFVIVIAAAEVGVGLAIVLQLYRLRRSTAVDEVPLGDGETAADQMPLEDETAMDQVPPGNGEPAAVGDR